MAMGKRARARARFPSFPITAGHPLGRATLAWGERAEFSESRIDPDRAGCPGLTRDEIADIAGHGKGPEMHLGRVVTGAQPGRLIAGAEAIKRGFAGFAIRAPAKGHRATGIARYRCKVTGRIAEKGPKDAHRVGQLGSLQKGDAVLRHQYPALGQTA